MSMSKTAQRQEDARQKAKDIWDKNKKRDAEIVSDREKDRRAEATKTARLRELRLAKEAADKEAKQAAPARKKSQR